MVIMMPAEEGLVPHRRSNCFAGGALVYDAARAAPTNSGEVFPLPV